MTFDRGRLLVAGCGYIGSAFAEAAAARGATVFGARRSAASLPRGVTPLRFDLAEPDTFPPLPDGIDAVVYSVSADHHTHDAYHAAYVASLKNLLAALQGTRQTPFLVFISSTGVYPHERGEWVDESTPSRGPGLPPLAPTAEALLEAESIAAGWSGGSVILRFAGIYGPGRDHVLRDIRNGTARYSRLPVYTNRVHRDDCVGMIGHVLALDDPADVYICADDAPVTRNEVLGWLGNRIGVPLRDDAFEPDGADRSRGNKRCRNSRIKQSGYELRYPTYREGYEAIITATHGT